MNLAQSPLALLAYHITEQLYAGSRTLVYRAVREVDQKPVVIKLLKNEHPTFSELVQFRNQYIITKNLDLPGIIQPYSLEPYRNGYALIMEDLGGISLGQWMNRRASSKDAEIENQPHVVVSPCSCVSINDFFPIALQLCDTLHLLHQQRIIHKDIKPANILIHPETRQVKLIDFSIASLLPREAQEIQSPGRLEGTLAYLSPEQTGRMNRGIDYRSDFYSLGVTFFELLSRKLPFQAHDPMEMVHCHIAKQPLSVCDLNAELPLMLGEIVYKLMAKNAEDRYQSALGLKHDLLTCQQQWQQTGKHTRFELGQCDVCDRFLIPEKLYGREQEVEILLESFDRVANGASEMILVAGFSGIGKTAVVNEVHKPIARGAGIANVRQRGYFIKGKYDQFNRNIPFSAFVQAFRDLMGQLLSESDAELEQWKISILEALADNTQVIMDVIPELEKIVGKQPPAPELLGTAAQNRFNLLFQKFIQVFATPEHPLVMFLDDLQWADSASLNLIQVLMSQGETGYLLLIGAYRDNEVSPAHPLMLTLDAAVKAGVTVNTITLAPLSQTSLNELVADTLQCTPEIAQPLTHLVYQKTQGNPFFAIQFLKALYEDGWIKFDMEVGRWQCDIAVVRSLSLTDDVVEFMALQLQKLPDETQTVLKLAACIGNQFDLNTLAIVSEQSETETATALWKALQEGLILPQSEVYKFYLGENDSAQTAKDETLNYKFLHDRVQQAAYSLIPKDRKQATHLKIGQLLFQETKPSSLEEKLFDIVNHLNVGKFLITQLSKRTELAQLNLTAGRKAKLATAYSAAIAYFTTGRELLAQDCWQSNYELTLALHEATAEVAFLNGQFEQLDAIAAIALKSAKTLLDRIAIYEIQIQAYLAQNRLPESLQTALDVLNQLGIQLPKTPNMAQILLGLAKTKLILTGKKTPDLLNLPTMSKPEKLAAMRILASASSVAFISAPKLFPLLAFQQVNLSVQYGNTSLSAYTYAYYGIILCGVLVDIDGGYEFGQLALQILDKFNAKELRSKVIFTANCFIFHWKQHMNSTLSGLQEAYQVGWEIGDVEYAGWAAAIWGSHSYWIGHELSDLVQTLHHYSEAVKQAKQHNPLVLINIYRQVVLNLLGESPNPSILDGSAYSEAQNAMQEASGDRTGLFFYYVNQICLSYLFGEFSNAVKQAIIAKQFEEGGTSVSISVSFYFYDSLARLALYSTATKSEQSQILRHITQNQKKLQKWAGYAPMNCLHKFHLIEAERYRVLRQQTQALDMYDRAIAGAKENEYIQEAALANELTAKFYLDWGKARIAQEHMLEAYYGYARWGAKAKVADLETHYPQLLAPILQQVHPQFAAEAYIQTWQSKSLLCSPILYHGKLLGMVYLENNLVTGAFTNDRVELLNMLCVQAAISLENARLYGRSQQYTQQLEVALKDLQQAQLQIVQSEKMSALGNLVAGVAHEINNPIGFIAGNLQPALDYIQDTFKLIDLYEQEYPYPSAAIQEEIAAIDLEYVREDLPKLIGSMQLGVQRIRDISNSLRTFSRSDKDYKVPFTIHEGIDSTILILKHRLKANDNRPEIEIVKTYGNLPSVECFPGQLNQVFMNLLANAIDALEEANQKRTFADIKANPNRIEIQTQLDDSEKQVVIQIRDNGVGMPDAVKQRVFDHLFTTKAVGKGTGLGLAIANQIVLEKHSGCIDVRSQLGEGTIFTIMLPIKSPSKQRDSYVSK